MARPGTFKPGASGNPKGRPPAIPPELKALCQAQTETAVRTLIEIMKDKEAPAPSRVAASNSLLDRGWGKPAQPLEGGDKPIRIIVNRDDV